MSNVYDVAIIGAGVAGTFAALRIVEKHDAKTILIDVGRPPAKRRLQGVGFLGFFPGSDGKLYPNDFELVKAVADGRKAKPAYDWVYSHLEKVNPMKLVTTNKKLPKKLKDKFQQLNFNTQFYNYYQWQPDSIHALSRLISSAIEEKVDYSFDNEVYSIRKSKSEFVIETTDGVITAKKIILCVGRSGWRWVTNFYDDLGIIHEDDWARYGIRVEMPAANLADFGKSHLRLYNDTIDIGPLSWNGTVIPEDHSDLVISAFRSNEARWRSEKVSFSLLKSVFYDDQGSVQTDRIGKLSFLLFNDRVGKEKIKSFMLGNSQLNLMPEYSWLKEELLKLEEIFPKICNKGYLHVPNIDPMAAKIKLGANLESEIEGMFVAGESAGIKGILSAAVTGTICSDSACK